MSEAIVLVHGGAGRIADELRDAARAGVRAAAQAGREMLRAGGDAEAAVVAAVRVLEDDPTFNAGRGACLTEAGTYEMDAAIMCDVGRIGAVAAVPDLADAILVAQAVMHGSPHHVLAGAGAVAFARAHGVGTFDRDRVWTAKAQARFDAAMAGRAPRQGQADTVGAVVLDAAGRLCVGGSTGGVLLKHPGRVGDTPLCGAGFYAAPGLGAAAASGLGEAILARVASYEVLRRIAAGEDPQAAARAVCREVALGEATCGLIVVTPDGRTAVAHHSEHLSWALARGDAEVEADLSHA